ncbi:chondroitin proteoglycan 2-like [Penaeus vannamei]|uniref:chondroitin proteoglycan 2-like n=1 Tax=Penaeus vannamei TaxID=6689 RepID=UPI00387F5DE1
MYAHPRDCSKFVTCAHSQPAILSCPSTLVFNAAKKVCDWPENVQCTSASDAECALTNVGTVTDDPVTEGNNGDNTEDCNFVCPEVEGMYSHPRDCSKFVTCAHSQPAILSCPSTLVFNAAKKVCDWPENVQCTSASDAECALTNVGTVTDDPVTEGNNGDNTEDCNFVCPEVEGMYAHPRDCSKFVTCVHSQPITLSCPSTLVFNAAKKICDWSENVQCTSASDAECVLTNVGTVTDAPVTTAPLTTAAALTTSSGECNFICPGKGLYPHPRKCSEYVSCDNSVAHVLQCPAGLHYNPTSKNCDWPQNGACSDNEEASCTLYNPRAPRTLPNPNEQICDCEYCLKPHPNDCTSYYYCAPGADAQFHACSEGLVFHPEFKQCVLQTQYPQCQPEVPPTCDPTCECLYPSEICSEYFKCTTQGIPIKYECTGGLLFNDNTYRCDLPQNVQCSETRLKRSLTYDDAPQQYVIAEECKQLEGKFAVEGNASAYYLCSHGTAHLMRCPDLAVFSSAAQDCIFMKNVRCRQLSYIKCYWIEGHRTSSTLVPSKSFRLSNEDSDSINQHTCMLMQLHSIPTHNHILGLNIMPHRVRRD